MQSQNKKQRKLSFKSLLLYVFGALCAAALVAHFAWKYSGSDQQKLVIEKDGIKVYTIKSPGSSLLKIVATRRLATTMDKAVAMFVDDSLENCVDWDSACYVSRAVEPWDPKTKSYTQLWTKDFGTPFAPREFVLDTKLTNDMVTNVVTVQFKAVPDKLPPDDCCFRVQHMSSRWEFTPAGEGQIDVKLLSNLDVGVPYFLFNMEAPENIYGAFKDLPRLFNSPRYANARIEWLHSAE
jgi:hypothetical protein